MNTNSENPKVGKTFQEMVCKSVSEYFQVDFDLEVAIPIGHPSKNHKFDCVSDDTTKVLCIKKAVHLNKQETLAEYYVRIDGHLLRDVKVFEVDEQGGINVVRG